MKAGDSKAISHIWQLAHLKHYFGLDLATKSVDLSHAPSSVDQQNFPTEDGGAFSTKRPSVAEICSKPLTQMSS
jgi:hypothetical protein